MRNDPADRESATGYRKLKRLEADEISVLQSNGGGGIHLPLVGGLVGSPEGLRGRRAPRLSCGRRFAGMIANTAIIGRCLCKVRRTPCKEDLGSRRFGLPRIIDLMSRTDPTGKACSDSLPWPAGGIWRCKQPRTLTGPRDVPWTWVGLGTIMTPQALHRSSGPPRGLMPYGGN